MMLSHMVITLYLHTITTQYKFVVSNIVIKCYGISQMKIYNINVIWHKPRRYRPRRCEGALIHVLPFACSTWLAPSPIGLLGYISYNRSLPELTLVKKKKSEMCIGANSHLLGLYPLGFC